MKEIASRLVCRKSGVNFNIPMPLEEALRTPK